MKAIIILLIASLTSCMSYRSSSGDFLTSIGGKVSLDVENGVIQTNHEKSLANAASVAKHGIWGGALKSVAGDASSLFENKSDNDVTKSLSENGTAKDIAINESDNALALESLRDSNALESLRDNNALELESLKDNNATNIALDPSEAE